MLDHSEVFQTKRNWKLHLTQTTTLTYSITLEKESITRWNDLEQSHLPQLHHLQPLVVVVRLPTKRLK